MLNGDGQTLKSNGEALKIDGEALEDDIELKSNGEAFRANKGIKGQLENLQLKSDQENNVRIDCCQDRKSPTSKTLLPYIMHTLIFMC